MGLRGLLVGAGGLSLLVLSTSSLGVEAFVPSAGFSRQRSAVRLVPQQGHQSPLWTKAPVAKPVSLQAAAAGSAVASPEAGSTLLGRLRGLGKGLAISIPAAAISTVTGGALAGSLHAVTGPDHLAALLPRCIGKRWFQAAQIGAIWGFGHGLSAILIGMVAFFLKGRLSSVAAGFLPTFSVYTELLIGLSLIVIGALGIKEAMGYEAAHVGQSLSAAKTPNKGSSTRAVFLNGLLHGFSWDGTPTLAPALAFNSWGPVMLFLVSYGFGTMVSMGTATSLIGEGTVRVGEAFDEPEIPAKLAFGSSVVAILIGLFWTVKAVL